MANLQSLLLFVLSCQCWGFFSEYKTCGDPQCERVLSRVQAIRNYKGPDCRFLNFKKGDIIFVSYKLSGNREDLWAGSIDRQFGYFPKDAVEVEEIYTQLEKEIKIPTQGNDFFCIDEHGAIIEGDFGELNYEDQKDESPGALADTENHPGASEKLQPHPGTVDSTQATDKMEENQAVAQDPFDNTKPESFEKVGSSWIGNGLTGWLGLGDKSKEQEHFKNRKLALESKQLEEEVSTATAGWIGRQLTDVFSGFGQRSTDATFEEMHGQNKGSQSHDKDQRSTGSLESGESTSSHEDTSNTASWLNTGIRDIFGLSQATSVKNGDKMEDSQHSGAEVVEDTMVENALSSYSSYSQNRDGQDKTVERLDTTESSADFHSVEDKIEEDKEHSPDPVGTVTGDGEAQKDKTSWYSTVYGNIADFYSHHREAEEGKENVAEVSDGQKPATGKGNNPEKDVQPFLSVGGIPTMLNNLTSKFHQERPHINKHDESHSDSNQELTNEVKEVPTEPKTIIFGASDEGSKKESTNIDKTVNIVQHIQLDPENSNDNNGSRLKAEHIPEDVSSVSSTVKAELGSSVQSESSDTSGHLRDDEEINIFQVVDLAQNQSENNVDKNIEKLSSDQLDHKGIHDSSPSSGNLPTDQVKSSVSEGSLDLQDTDETMSILVDKMKDPGDTSVKSTDDSTSRMNFDKEEDKSSAPQTEDQTGDSIQDPRADDRQLLHYSSGVYLPEADSVQRMLVTELGEESNMIDSSIRKSQSMTNDKPNVNDSGKETVQTDVEAGPIVSDNGEGSSIFDSGNKPAAVENRLELSDNMNESSVINSGDGLATTATEKGTDSRELSSVTNSVHQFHVDDNEQSSISNDSRDGSSIINSKDRPAAADDGEGLTMIGHVQGSTVTNSGVGSVVTDNIVGTDNRDEPSVTDSGVESPEREDGEGASGIDSREQELSAVVSEERSTVTESVVESAATEDVISRGASSVVADNIEDMGEGPSVNETKEESVATDSKEALIMTETEQGPYVIDSTHESPMAVKEGSVLLDRAQGSSVVQSKETLLVTDMPATEDSSVQEGMKQVPDVNQVNVHDSPPIELSNYSTKKEDENKLNSVASEKGNSTVTGNQIKADEENDTSRIMDTNITEMQHTEDKVSVDSKDAKNSSEYEGVEQVLTESRDQNIQSETMSNELLGGTEDSGESTVQDVPQSSSTHVQFSELNQKAGLLQMEPNFSPKATDGVISNGGYHETGEEIHPFPVHVSALPAKGSPESSRNSGEFKKTLKDYKNLLNHMSVEHLLHVLDVLGKHKLLWLDYHLGNLDNGDARESVDNNLAILSDFERLLQHHIESTPSNDILGDVVIVEENSQNASLQKLLGLLSALKSRFTAEKMAVGISLNQAPETPECTAASCFGSQKVQMSGRFEKEDHQFSGQGDSSLQQSSNKMNFPSKAEDKQHDLIEMMAFTVAAAGQAILQTKDHILCMLSLLKMVVKQVLSSLPDDMSLGLHFCGLPWEAIVITAFLGLVTLLMFTCRFYHSIKSRLYTGRERKLGQKVAELLEEKCKVLETLSQCKQRYEELESALQDGGASAHVSEREELEHSVLKLEKSNAELSTEMEQLKADLKTQKSIRSQQEEMLATMQKTLRSLEDESHRIKSEIEQAQTTLKIYHINTERLQKNLQVAKEENTQLQESKAQLLQEADGWGERLSELEEEMKMCESSYSSMQEDCSNKDEHIKSLTECLLKMRDWDSEAEEEGEEATGQRSGRLDPTENSDDLGADADQRQKVQKLIYAAKMSANLKSLEEEKGRLFVRLADELKAKEDLQGGIEHLQSEKEQLQAESATLTVETQKLHHKLQIMTEMYQENELKLHRMLTVEERERLQKEEKLHRADKKISLAAEELNTYRQRAAELEEELEKTNQAYKNQIAAHEKKAHDNWLAARAAERDLADMRRESAHLRQKLTDSQFKLEMVVKDPYLAEVPGRALLRGERSPFGPSPLGRPSSETRAFLSPPTLMDGPPRLSPQFPMGPGGRVSRGPPNLADVPVTSEREALGPHSDSGSASPTWERERRGPGAPPGYPYADVGHPYRRLPPPGVFPPGSVPARVLGPAEVHSFMSHPGDKSGEPSSTVDGLGLSDSRDSLSSMSGELTNPPGANIAKGTPLGPPMMGPTPPLDPRDHLPRRGPYVPPEFFPPRGPPLGMHGPPPPGMFPRFPPMPPQHMGYLPARLPPDTISGPPRSPSPASSEQPPEQPLLPQDII